MDDFNALVTVLDTPPLRPTAARPPETAEFIRQFLTDGEVAELDQEFASSCEPNKQVMWTGIAREAAQKWADDRGMQTLSTAMGPLRTRDASRKHPGKKGLTKYMRGASAEFAWHIARTSHVVTVLCPPPPQRFNPGGGTNMQLVELPILTGIIGGHAVARIIAIHPTVPEAADFWYQFWPFDQCDIWRKRYAQSVDGVTQWLQRSRKASVIRIEEKLRLTLNGTNDMVVIEAILPQDTAASTSATGGETRLATNAASASNRSKAKGKKKETDEKQRVKAAPTALTALEDEGGAKSKTKSQTTKMMTAPTTKAKKETKKETKKEAKKNTKTNEKNVTKTTKLEPPNKSKAKTKAKTKEKTKGETKGKGNETAKNMKGKSKEESKKQPKQYPKGNQPMQTEPVSLQGHKNGSKSKRKAGTKKMDKDMCISRMSPPARVNASGQAGNMSVAGGRDAWIVLFVAVAEAGCFWFFGRSL
ncbi:uncharacterized protein SPSK_07509 [Sporothrix schenckii 1099-18]|uniref:Uncharacterized protein n=1 Tax=Sporothrix schenckii 1099-18 TaxID=1397361 RepID=A0A0F2MFT7_SPOSC|nr:uncharacterized protein SPSK_07509 [Sporothrix schenckii 1099-18]KJR88563.1 hypothetical protein SPSK_07509 [Sporothrix schenckii 1099-18]